MKRSNKTIIQKEQAGLILEQWLTQRFSYLSKEKWLLEIESGRLVLNDVKATSGHCLVIGDCVEYFPPERPEPPVDLTYQVVYEDEDLLMINKPNNLPCHPAGRFFNHTLWAILKQKYEQFHIINRLDRETSGLIIVALNKKAASHISKQIMNRNVTKAYYVLVHGEMKQDIEAEGWLVNDEESEIRKKRRFTYEEPSDEKAQTSSTWFYPEKSNSQFSLVRVKLGTGRLHQIRATVFSLGYPVVGDKIYGLSDQFYLKYINGLLNEDDKGQLVLGSQALHAYYLKFLHPTTKEEVEFEAEIPQVFTTLLEN